MGYCSRCGAYIPMGESACPACGYDPEAESAREAGRQQGTSGAAWQSEPHTTGREEPPQQERQAWEPWACPDRAAPCGREPRGAAGDEGRLSVLSYVGPLFLLPLLLRRGDPFVRFHANQGLCLFLLECLVSLVGGPLRLIGSVFCLYCLVRGVKTAAAGRWDKLPLIGDIRLLK